MYFLTSSFVLIYLIIKVPKPFGKWACSQNKLPCGKKKMECIWRTKTNFAQIYRNVKNQLHQHSFERYIANSMSLRTMWWKLSACVEICGETQYKICMELWRILHMNRHALQFNYFKIKIRNQNLSKYVVVAGIIMLWFIQM